MQTKSVWKNNNFTFADKVFGPAINASIWQLCPLAALNDPSVAHVFFDDFFMMQSTKASAVPPYTITEDDGAGGTDAIQDAAGGVYRHYCDGDANDEAYLHTTREQWKFAAGKSLWFEARIAIHEANTDDAAWFVGLTDQAAANMVVDTGTGPAASYDGAGFFGVKDSLNIYFETSNAATQSTAADVGDYVSGTFVKLGFWVKTEASTDTTAEVIPYVNGIAQTAHSITLAGLEEMEFCIGIKGAGAEESFSIDYVKIVQIR